MESKKAMNSPSNLENREQSWRCNAPRLQKAIIVRTVWYWPKTGTQIGGREQRAKK